MTGPRRGWPTARWRDSQRLYAALWIGIAVLMTACVIATGVTTDPPAVRHAAAAALPTSGESEPRAHASGARPGPTRVTPTSAPPTASLDPETADSPRPSTETRSCRCAPRSPVAPTTTAPSSTVAASSPADPPADPQPGAVTPQPGATAGLLELVNADRLANNCGPVAPSSTLDNQSQAWAEQQARDEWMRHSAGGFDGENVAAGQRTAAEVHADWMASEGHRANILNCDFTVMGAGAADSGTGVRYWTEQFAT